MKLRHKSNREPSTDANLTRLKPSLQRQRLELQREWRRFSVRPLRPRPPLPADPVSLAAQTHHRPVPDGASAAADQQTDDLHGRQAALVQRHRDHLQRGLRYR